MAIKRWIIILLALLTVPAHAAPRSKVVMLVIPAVSLSDLASSDLPSFGMLMDRGSVGLMNSRTAGRIVAEAEIPNDNRTPESGYLTIGAGSRAIAGLEAAKAFDRHEIVEGAPAPVILQRLTMVDPGASEVVHTRIARLARDNSTLNHTVSVGLIGSALHKSGLRTAVIGSSDDAGIHREAALIAMDESGLVDFGNVGPEMTMRDRGAPLGVRTNELRLLREASRCIRLADFVVIELGDSARLDRDRLDIMDDIYNRQRAGTLRRMDRMLGRVMKLVDSKSTTLIVLSPYPSSYALEKSANSLCPVIVMGPRFGQGVLTSGSTRVTGAVTNTDIAPSILAWLRVPMPPALVGRPIASRPSALPTTDLARLDKRISLQTMSQPVLRQAMVTVIALVAIVMVLWLIVPAGHADRRRLFPTLILIPAAMSPAMMLIALIPSESQLVTWVHLIVVTGALTAIAMLVGRRPLNALMILSLGASALLLGNLAAGASVCRFSIMGYSIPEGARYYGIGNEFMGALIGSSLVGIGLLLRAVRAGQRATQIALVCLLILVTMAIGSPVLGANAGGAIGAMIGFGSALVATSKKPLGARKVLGIILGIGVALAVLASLDALRGGQSQSHLGRALHGMREGGPGQIGLIVERKLAMNAFLIRVSIWSRLLGVYIAGTVLALAWGGALSRLRPLPLHVGVALFGAIGGTLGALVFNDSGIVAAATAFVYVWSLVLLAVLDTEQPPVTQ